MSERTEIVDLGFQVADAQAPRLELARQSLQIEFTDWRNRLVRVDFEDCIAARWQEAERFLDDSDRYDSVVQVLDSEWIAEHEAQGHASAGGREFRHLKLNFNAAGQLEVLCTTVKLLAQ